MYLDLIKRRSLDEYVKLEEDIVTSGKSNSNAAAQLKKEVLAVLDPAKGGTAEDKMRLFLIYYVTHQNLPQVCDFFSVALFSRKNF